MKEHGQQQHNSTNQQGRMHRWWTAAQCRRSSIPPDWWQQSSFFPSAQCEDCEANMTMTLHFPQWPSQSGACAYRWDVSVNSYRHWLTKRHPFEQLWLILAFCVPRFVLRTLHGGRSFSVPQDLNRWSFFKKSQHGAETGPQCQICMLDWWFFEKAKDLLINPHQICHE